jgi:hypothetical protein
MKKICLFLSVLMLSVVLFGQKTINDPNAEVRQAKDFTAISVSHAFDVYLTQGNEEAVVVSASEEKYRKDIIVEVSNGVLKISFRQEGKFWKGWNGNKLKLKAYISFKKLTRLVASGACDIHVDGTINADDLSINLSGASDLKEGKINARNLTVDLSGASSMKITGSANKLDVEVSGASDFKSFDFNADVCNAHASGASDINVTVNKELSAHASGASDIYYKGSGMIKDIKTSGSSNVRKT